MARTMPSLTTSLLQITGLAMQRLAVKTLALADDGPSLTTRARSSPPEDFRPAATPPARKPAGWVTLMEGFLRDGCSDGCSNRDGRGDGVSLASPGVGGG